MLRFIHIFVWLSRIFHCRGFGVQSPTDYAFVRYVINEHWPYYKYDEIGQGDHWLKRKVGQLYFRLANWRQPETVFGPSWQEYVKAGCCRCRMTAQPENAQLAIVSSRQQAERVLANYESRTVLVLDGRALTKELWHEIASAQLPTIAFDLYYCAIVIFNPKRTQQSYKINF